MASLSRQIGIARSLIVYYGVPGRAARMRALYRAFVAPGGVCFDIGAHAGNRVRVFRQLGARVVAVEPQPDFVRLLHLLYGRDRGVTIVPVAAARSPGEATLYVSDRTPTVSTLSAAWQRRVRKDPSFARVAWREGGRVALITLDALIAEHGVPAFVKIDVEGYEAEVLAGLSHAVPALSFEYVGAARDVALACVDRLESLGAYRYNHARGESQRLALAAWVGAAAMRELLAGMPEDGGSGDVYARLAGERIEQLQPQGVQRAQ